MPRGFRVTIVNCLLIRSLSQQWSSMPGYRGKICTRARVCRLHGVSWRTRGSPRLLRFRRPETWPLREASSRRTYTYIVLLLVRAHVVSLIRYYCAAVRVRRVIRAMRTYTHSRSTMYGVHLTDFTTGFSVIFPYFREQRRRLYEKRPV